MSLSLINQDRLLRCFLELCSVNTPAKQELVLVERVTAELEALGLICVRDNAHDKTGGNCGNLICTLPATVPDCESIFFSSHFDTVEPTGGLVIHVEAGTVRSDGSTILGADDKCGIAPIIEAMRVIVENGLPHGDIQLLLTVSEEIGLLGAHHIDRSLIKARMGWVLDTGPPVGSLVYTAPTQKTLEVTLTGLAAHAGFEPEKGISAIQMAARAISNMPLGRIDAETTANVGILEGGKASNVVCPRIRMKAEARSRDISKLEKQVKAMTDAINEACHFYGGSADIQINHMYDGYNLNSNSPVLEIARQASRNLGLPDHLRTAGGGSDANVFNAMGLPTSVLATGMCNIHTHDEHVAVQDMVLNAAWIIEIVRLVSEKYEVLDQ